MWGLCLPDSVPPIETAPLHTRYITPVLLHAEHNQSFTQRSVGCLTLFQWVFIKDMSLAHVSTGSIQVLWNVAGWRHCCGGQWGDCVGGLHEARGIVSILWKNCSPQRIRRQQCGAHGKHVCSRTPAPCDVVSATWRTSTRACTVPAALINVFLQISQTVKCLYSTRLKKERWRRWKSNITTSDCRTWIYTWREKDRLWGLINPHTEK